MSFRSRLLITFFAAVLLPMIALAVVIHREMTERLTAQYATRVEALVKVIEQDLDQEARTVAARLEVIKRRIVDDNRFRQAAVDRASEQRRYLLDYAGDAMRLAGLSMLQIQDDSGRIISSGHFRNEFDRLDPALPALLASTAGTALVRTRAPDAPFVALATVDSFTITGRCFTMVAGVRIEERFLDGLARGDEIEVALAYPEGLLSSGDGTAAAGVTRELVVSYVDSEVGGVTSAQFRVTHRLDELRALRNSINRWFVIAVAAAAALSVGLAGWLASRISRPIVALADKTSRIDLDRLDVDFEAQGSDEIGTLSRMLAAMTERLRASAVLVKDAERRATLGELARQVNHDIKNGLTPIRNVLRHLDELARTNERELSRVFRERQGTLNSGISYLENLATNYARLSPRREQRQCDIDAILDRVTRDARASGDVDIQLHLNGGAVVGDPVSLRRVFENLVTNAVESLAGGRGRVSVTSESIVDDDGTRVRVVVSDNGIGMSEEQKKVIFDDFYTTKDSGTGLGLSIVRRLVMDLGGSVQVESQVGGGSRFIVDLPQSDLAPSGRTA